MSMVWHIAKKDFRQLHLTVAFYGLLIAAKLALGAWLVHSGHPDPESFTRAQIYGNLLIGLEVLTGYVLVAAFVHEHPLVGTRAEWMTRPVSGGRLLAAKLLGLGFVMAVLPFLISLPWWLSCDYGAHELKLAAAEMLLRQAVVVVPALALAVLTDGFDRYVIWLLVLFGTGFGASMLPPVKAAVAPPSVAETREWLTLLVAALTACLVVTNQFLTRRTGRGVALLCVGLLLMAVSAWWWPLSLERFRLREAAVTPQVVPAGEIRLAFERARVVKHSDHEPAARIGLAALGVPPDIKLRGVTAEQSWQWSNVKLDRTGQFSEESFATSAPALRALGLAVPRMDPAWFAVNAERTVRMGLLGQPILPQGVGLVVETPVRPVYAAQMVRERSRYTVRARLELYRPEVLGEQPLQINGLLERPHDHVRMARFELSGDNLRVTLVEYEPAFNWKNPGRYVGTRLAGTGSPVEYFLVNRPRGNASQGFEIGVQRARFGTVAITWRTLVFAAPREWISGRWVERPGWFQNLTLAKIANRQIGEVQRELCVEQLEIAAEK